MRKFFVCCMLLSFVLVFSVLCSAQGGYTFSYVPGSGYVCNSVLPSGLYELSAVFSSGISGAGSVPVDVSFDASGVANEITLDVQLFDSSGDSMGSVPVLIYLQHVDISTVFLGTVDDPLGVSSIVFSPVSVVPSQDVSSLMLAVSGLLSGNFNVKNILIVIAAAVGLSVGIVLLWFNFHYIKFKLSGALRKGRL